MRRLPRRCAGCLRAQHSRARPANRQAPAARCQDCHGGAHEVLACGSPNSPVNHANIPVTCGRCHGQKFLMESSGDSAQPFISYQDSVHGRATENGSIRPPSAPIATARTRSSRPTMRSLRSTSSMFPPPAANATPRSQSTFNAEHPWTGDRAWQPDRRRSARTATAFTQSSRTTIPTRRSAEQNVSRDTCARCHEGVRLSRSSAFRAIAYPVTWTAITGWRPKAARWSRPTAQAAMACTTFCLPAIRIRPSIAPISTPPAASATRESRRNSRRPRCTWPTAFIPTTSARSPCAGCASIYIILILVVIGAMFVHNVIIWRSKAAGAAAHAESDDGAHDRESALAASDSAHKLHHSGHYRLRAQVP